ncbi:MAG TPA: hypothetical protein DEP87_04805 [Candidatus Pacebacteria bacterium]|nr:hypothetical protein [Candidatus Paceibacterota bacterium]
MGFLVKEKGSRFWTRARMEGKAVPPAAFPSRLAKSVLKKDGQYPGRPKRKRQKNAGGVD